MSSARMGLHFFVVVPLLGRADLDLLVVDRDGDGGYKCEVKWDLPGEALDSGPSPVVVSVPVDILFGDMAKLAGYLLEATGAPALVVRLAHGLRAVVD